MSALLRLFFLVPFGFICACIAAAAMTALSLFGFESQAEFLVPFLTAVTGITMWIGAIAILPAIIAIALAEAFAWRSILYYFAVGAIVALVADQVSELVIEPTFPGRRTVVMLAAGFVGGFVYWAIAGRLAGEWGVGGTAPNHVSDRTNSGRKGDSP